MHGDFFTFDDVASYVDVNVVIEGVQYELQQVTTDVLSQHTVDWHVRGITDPLGQLVSWLWEQISMGLDSLANTVWGFLQTIRDQIVENITGAISSMQSALSSAITQLSDSVSAFVTSIEGTISGFIQTVTDMMANVSTLLATGLSQLSTTLAGAVQAVYDYLTSLGATITGAISQLQSAFTSAIEWLSTQLGTLSSLVSSAVQSLVTAVQGVVVQIQDAFAWLSTQLGNMAGTIVSAVQSVLQNIWESLQGAVAQIGAYIQGVVQAFQKGFAQVMDYFNNLFRQLQNSVNQVQIVLAGFVNPLTNIWNTLQNIYKWFESFSWENITKFFTEQVPSAIWQFITSQLPQMISTLLELFEKHVIEPARAVLSRTVQNLAQMFTAPVQALMKGAVSQIAEMKGWFKLSTPPADPSEILTRLMTVAVPFLVAGISAGIVTDLLQTEVQVLGNKASFRLRAISNILSSWFSGETYVMPLMWSVFQATVLPAMSIWFNYQFRPRMPSEEEALDWYYWGKVTADELKTILAFMGYSDDFSDAVLETSRKVLSESDLEDVYYRLLYFEKLSDATIKMALPEREVQISLASFKNTLSQLKRNAGITNVSNWFKAEMRKHRYDDKTLNAKLIADMKLPSVNDLITFVVREIISPADFFVACQMQKLHPYWASAYWEAHWRLPSFENLREAFWRGIISADEFKKYIIWHDYRPFPRPDISKSDVDIMMQLQWRLPTRIDTRWMAKYGLINWSQHLKLVQMEGYPDGDPYNLGFNIAETVAKAEIINVVVDERTLWRNRLFDMFERGYMTLAEIRQKFEAGFTTTIDNVEFKVGFHQLEIELMLEAVKLERQRRLADERLDSLIEAYVYGAIPYEEFSQQLKQIVKDDEVRKAIEQKCALKKLRRLISDIRRQAEKVIDRVLYLYERGLATEDEVKEAIEKYVGTAQLEKEELELILEESKWRREYWFRDKVYDLSRRLYQYGKLDSSKYKELLQKYGWTSELAELEATAYDYFLTRIDDIANRIARLYAKGKLNKADAESLMKKLGLSDEWIRKRLQLAEVESVIYKLGD